MKMRTTAFLLAAVMLCSGLWMTAAAYETSDEPDNGERTVMDAEIPALYQQVPELAGSLSKEVSEPKSVFTPVVLSQKQHEKLASAADFHEISYSRNFSTKIPQEKQQDSLFTTVSHSFSGYGSQLAGLYYTFDNARNKRNIYVGTAMQRLYDNVLADVRKGASGAVFSSNEQGLQRLGVSITVPSASELGYGSTQNEMELYHTQLENMAKDIGWIVYLCIDCDEPEMFYSNGYCNMGYAVTGNRLTFYVVPEFRKGYETIEQRRYRKKQLETMVEHIVALSENYKSAYGKMKFFDQWLCENNQYNNIAATEYSTYYYSANVSGDPWSPVSAILSGSDNTVYAPVCEGYARAFQLLCKRVGIDATVICGSNHMWNNVRYGNTWCAEDATWNDEGSYSSGEYFLSAVNGTYGHLLNDMDFTNIEYGGWFRYPKLTAIPDAGVLPFYDVPEDFWGRESIQMMYDKQYMVGINCVTFGTGEPLTRAQFAQVLYNIGNGKPVKYTAKFTDVPKNEWYTNAVLWAAENELIYGYPEQVFLPDIYISRQDMVLIMYRYAQKYRSELIDPPKENDPTVDEDDDPKDKDDSTADQDNPKADEEADNDSDREDIVSITADHSIEDLILPDTFRDVNEVAQYAYPAMVWAVHKNIIRGDNDMLMPRGNTSRAQCAAIISRIM